MSSTMLQKELRHRFVASIMGKNRNWGIVWEKMNVLSMFLWL